MLRSLAAIVGLSLVALILASIIESHREVLPGLFAKVYCDGLFVNHLPRWAIEQYELEGMSWVASVDIDNVQQHVTTTILGRSARAMYVNAQLGCVLLPNATATVPEVFRAAFKKPIKYDGDGRAFGDTSRCADIQRLTAAEKQRLQQILDLDIAKGVNQTDHTRALAVVHCGQLVAESYASHLNVTVATPLLGWSMTKSIVSLLTAMRVEDKALSWDTQVDLAADGLDASDIITATHLLNMEDGLNFPEMYGLTGAPSRMLHARSSAAAFARSMTPPRWAPGRHWCYTSGATNILSELLEKSFSSRQEYLEYPYRRLFGPLGASSFVMETDYEGHFIGSSFSFATARDWGRVGQLLLQHGHWRGQWLIPRHFVEQMVMKPLASSGGVYSGGWWHIPREEAVLSEIFVEDNHRQCGEAQAKLVRDLQDVPKGAVLASGYRGQYLIVVPELNAVLVRLGHNWNPADRSNFFQSVFSILRRTGKD